KAFTFTSSDTANTDAGGNPLGGSDTVYAGAGKDIVLGGQAGDLLHGEADDDDLIGGHNVAGGQDGNDTLDGGLGQDVVAGDNAEVLRRGDALSPRVRVLSGAVLYDANGTALVTAAPQLNPTGVESRTVTLFDHSTTPAAGTFGSDYLAGGGGDDLIFGELGDDTIQGDGSVSLTVAAAAPSAEDWAGAGTDGDDYVEGGGGNDLIFGNLGQDDLVGGSSNLFGGLAAPANRPDGRDTIFGGAGTRTARNDPGDTTAAGHARDADTLLGDNGNILRLVGTNGVSGGGFLPFTYHSYGPAKGIPRDGQPPGS